MADNFIITRCALKVLIVADDELEAQSVRHILSSHGHRVHVTNSRYYLDAVEKFSPNVLVTDIFTHNKSPLNVVQDAKNINKMLYIVAVDSSKKYFMKFYRDTALAMGADAAIMNPVEPLQLLEAVESCPVSHLLQKVASRLRPRPTRSMRLHALPRA